MGYGYDDAGRLASVKRDAEPSSSYEYDFAGRRKRITLANGVSTEYAYGVNDRLDALTTAKGTSTLAKFAYTHDSTGNRTGIEYADGSKSIYEFDNAYRLTRDKRLSAANAVLYDESYTYDSVGNRLSKARTGWNPVSVNYVYNERNQLTSSSDGMTYQYDANGNTIGINSASGNESMHYDVLNRLVRYAGPGGVEETSYRGGAYQRWKVSETTTGSSAVQTAFLYDNDDVVADYVGNTSALSRLYVTPGLDQNLSMTVVSGPDAGTYYYSQDGLGSVRTLTDSAGLVKNHYDYTAFGEPYAQSVNLMQRYAYTGRELRPITGDSMHYRYRNYYPGMGRFDRRDPTGYESNPFGNLYAYVDASPAMYTDPMGLGTETMGMLMEQLLLIEKLISKTKVELDELLSCEKFGDPEVARKIASLRNRISELQETKVFLENEIDWQINNANKEVDWYETKSDAYRYRYDPAGNVLAVYHGAFVPEGTAVPASRLRIQSRF